MIRGVVAAVPNKVRLVTDRRLAVMTGIAERHLTTLGQDVLTLAEAACTNLLRAFPGVTPDAVVFVTQTPAHAMPSMACSIHAMLGLPKSVPCFDVNMACSGYVYGLWLCYQLRDCRRILLITGDTITKVVNPETPETRELFGDCVAATMWEQTYGFLKHRMFTDGSGVANLMADPFVRMNGQEVFSFVLREVPALIEEMDAGEDETDWYLFHQANAYMLKHLGKRANIPAEKMPINIARYGNTSSASIPLLMCDSAATNALLTKENEVVMIGFGAGWSWGWVRMNLDHLDTCEVVEVA